MIDAAADTDADRIAAATTELENEGVAYGDLSLNIALHGELAEIERDYAGLNRIFGALDAKLIHEGFYHKKGAR